MVFFKYDTDASGQMVFTVAPQMWYYVAITAPLTLLVFAIWDVWRRKRQTLDNVKFHVQHT
jgi:hypothetical protein